MYELIKTYQLDIMLGLSSICAVVGLFSLITKSLPKRRKLAIADMEFAAAILLFSDRLAYIYHGDPGTTGYWMVRISNFLVFFMTISVVHAFNIYLADLCSNEMALEKIPVRLRIVEAITGIGWLLVIISQFIGLYYTFDENNAYQRGPGFIICYAIPFIALFFQLSVVVQYFRRLSYYISIPILLFTVIPLIASVVQALYYGVSLTNMAIVGMGVVLYIFAIIEMNDKLERAQRQELNEARDLNNSVLKSYVQTVEAVAKVLDSKDRYTRNHSRRVAEYSMDMARALNLDEKGCYEIYCSALLHDIGKAALPDSLLGHKGHFSAAEEETYRKHTVIGGEILSEVSEIPFLRVAAQSHHERYDGRGYPEGLRGDEIPLTARIVAVADAYDDMTSFKRDRGPLPQGRAREEILKGSGSLYDPKIVSLMVDMIDRDVDYMLRETEEENVEVSDINDLTKVKRMHFDNYKELVSDGIRISKEYLKIRFETCPDAGFDRQTSIPAVILFDSFDRCVHRNARTIRNAHYIEYCEIWMDGHAVSTAARDIKTDVRIKESGSGPEPGEWIVYDIETVSFKDHVTFKINSRYIYADVTVALPDSTRFCFFAVTGEHCSIRNFSIKEFALGADENTIPRIAPEKNFFTRREGDIPNLQVDAYRETATKGLPVEDGMRLFFHSQSLPSANLVHHCAYILIFSSEDGTVSGRNYTEFLCIRLDGDEATEDGKAENRIAVRRSEDFAGWDAFKLMNLRGLDYVVDFRRKRNRISFETENAGIFFECQTTVPEGTDNVYVALTGNLCTLTDIRVR